ncbi:MAG: Transthyretin [Marmoricola sp.]|nr:Transthyretin [Marmoricola sp.]
MTTLSTHVLDAVRGVPASGLDVALATAEGTPIETATTDADGRIGWSTDLGPGAYGLRFDTGTWFAAAQRDTFFPVVLLAVEITGHHAHVALLLSPFSYTTYKGS